ncbi:MULTISPECIES: hypothetical protein [Anaeromyxobacter]|uniref:hypothetical protein n=1 Tax=Anaeromyxobacter TaxID=161492 RepID=UPI001F5817ED|nr:MULTISPECIES: hypothetical protein [unclassified Anaeromyxobacter]
MSDTNDKGGARKLAVYAIPDSANGERTWWPKIGVAFTNRDGSIAILLDALPLGTNKLQVRELREDGRPAGNGAPRRAGLETVEVRP